MRRDMPAKPWMNIGMKMKLMNSIDKREMHLAPEFVHQPPRRFRIPIIDAGKNGEDRPRRHDVMEMADDVIAVVQLNVAGVEAQRQPGQTADAEHRQKADRKQHRRVEANGTAPQAKSSSAVRMMTDGMEIIIVVVWKNVAMRMPMPVRYMWCAQTTKDMKPEDHRGINQRAIAPQRLAGVVGDDFRHNAHRRQNQHINFRMRQEPEQMLPQQRTSAAGDVQRLPGNHQARRQEKAGAKGIVHQLQATGRFQRREGQQQQERR